MDPGKLKSLVHKGLEAGLDSRILLAVIGYINPGDIVVILAENPGNRGYQGPGQAGEGQDIGHP